MTLDRPGPCCPLSGVSGTSGACSGISEPKGATCVGGLPGERKRSKPSAKGQLSAGFDPGEEVTPGLSEAGRARRLSQEGCAAVGRDGARTASLSGRRGVELGAEPGTGGARSADLGKMKEEDDSW